MKSKKLVKNKYFLLLMFGIISSIVLVVLYVPIFSYEDPFVSITGQFDMFVNPDDFAPDSTIQELMLSPTRYGKTVSGTTSVTKLFTSYPNTFSSCNIGDRVNYFDTTGKKYFLDGNQRDIVPLTTNALISTQTNRNIDNFLIDTHGTCTITSTLSGFSKLKAVADSGTVKHEFFYAKPDGTMTQIYTKSNTLNVKGLDLSTDKNLFSAKILASELESKMSHPTDSYKSNIRLKTTIDLQLHYVGVTGVESTKWMIGGSSESTLKVTVTNDKYQCLVGCLFTNKEIKTEFTPSDGNVKVKSIMNFKVTLPEWNAEQGSPSFRVVNSETGADVTAKSPLTLSKTGTSGTGTKSLLSPASAGKYDIIITHPNRDTAVIPINVYKEIVVPPEDIPGEKCPEGYVFVEDDCFLENPEPRNNPPGLDEANDFLKNFNLEEYYGIIAFVVILLIIVVIVKSLLKSKSGIRLQSG